MLEIKNAVPLEGRRLRLTLTDGSVVERDVTDLLDGPVFARLRTDDELFRRVRARYGTVTWPGNLDLAPETVIWGDDFPPQDATARPRDFLRVQSPNR